MSYMSILFIIIGITTIALFPPLGVIIIGAGFATGATSAASSRGRKAAAHAAAWDRAENAQILAYKSFTQ